MNNSPGTRSFIFRLSHFIWRAEFVRGLQHTKDKYVPITEEELESLEAEANRSIDLREFIPLASVDPSISRTLITSGADKGAEKRWRLLADAMAKSGRVAIAELVSRGKEQLVLICPCRKGLVLHTMYYGDEVRDFKQVPKGENVKVQKGSRAWRRSDKPAHIGGVQSGELQRRVSHSGARYAR